MPCIILQQCAKAIYSLRLFNVIHIQMPKNSSSCGFLWSLNSPPDRKYLCLCLPSGTLKCYNVKKPCQENLSDLPRSGFRELLHLVQMRKSDAKSSNRDVSDICHYPELRCDVVKPRETQKAWLLKDICETETVVYIQLLTWFLQRLYSSKIVLSFWFKESSV